MELNEFESIKPEVRIRFWVSSKIIGNIKGVGSETANEDVSEVNDDDTKVSNPCISCRFECFYQ